MGEKEREPFQFTFNGFLKVEFQGSRVTSDAGLVLVRELDERLGLATFISEHLSDSRRGLNTQFGLADLLRQSVYSRLAGYEDLNDAERLAADPAFRLIGSPKMWDRGAALTSTLHWFETELLTREENLVGLMAVNRDVLAQAELRDGNRVVLDMDSSESPVHGEQEGSAYNGHFESVCYHPLFVFDDQGDCLAAKLRPGNVASADDWGELLLSEIKRQQAEGRRVAVRADAAFARPEIYEALEAHNVEYAIRIPANRNLERAIEDILFRPRGRPSRKPLVRYKSFLYQADSWTRPRRVVAKVEHHGGELFPRVGFIVTNLTLPSRSVVRFYNKRGTAEQWIKDKLYLKGRYYPANLYTADGFKKGIGYLNQAIALDPAYALAYAGLAATYYDASTVYLPPKEAMPKAKAAAIHALKLDDTLAEAHNALAQVQAQYEWDWIEAGKHYRRALELSPSLATAHLFYGAYLAHQGRLAQGIDEMKRAEQLDPLTPLTGTYLGFYYYAARRYDEAFSQCRKVIEMDPNFALVHSVLGLVYEQQEKVTEAIAEFNEAKRLDPPQPWAFAYLGHAYAISGQKEKAREMIDEMMRRTSGQYLDPFGVAIVYTGLSEKDQAFAWLEKALQERSENFLFYKDSPILDSLRSDSRFTDLLRRMNLSP